MTALGWFVMVAFALAPACFAAGLDVNPYTKWPKGPPSDPGFFPTALWLQAPSNAQRYREAGFNTYVAALSNREWARMASVAVLDSEFAFIGVDSRLFMFLFS